MKKNICLFLVGIFFLSAQGCFGMEKIPLIKKTKNLKKFNRFDRSFYRSGLPTEKTLIPAIKKYKFGKIFAFTHKNEAIIRKIAEENNIRWEFLALPANGKPTLEEFKKLVHVAKNIDGPTLFYDKDGANRTGFFAALYLLLTSNKEYDEIMENALDQFSCTQFLYCGPCLKLYPSSGINFITKFGTSYLHLLALIKKQNLDPKNLDSEEEESKGKDDEYYHYTIAAIKS